MKCEDCSEKNVDFKFLIVYLYIHQVLLPVLFRMGLLREQRTASKRGLKHFYLNLALQDFTLPAGEPGGWINRHVLKGV